MAIAEVSRSGPKQLGQHEAILDTVHVALAADSDPDWVGKAYHATPASIATPSNAVTDFVCQQARIDKTMHAGRKFISARWSQLVAYA